MAIQTDGPPTVGSGHLCSDSTCSCSDLTCSVASSGVNAWAQPLVAEEELSERNLGDNEVLPRGGGVLVRRRAPEVVLFKRRRTGWGDGRPEAVLGFEPYLSSLRVRRRQHLQTIIS